MSMSLQQFRFEAESIAIRSKRNRWEKMAANLTGLNDPIPDRMQIGGPGDGHNTRVPRRHARNPTGSVPKRRRPGSIVFSRASAPDLTNAPSLPLAAHKRNSRCPRTPSNPGSMAPGSRICRQPRGAALPRRGASRRTMPVPPGASAGYPQRLRGVGTSASLQRAAQPFIDTRRASFISIRYRFCKA